MPALPLILKFPLKSWFWKHISWPQAVILVTSVLRTLISNLGCDNDCLTFFVIFPSFSRSIVE